MIAQQIKEIYPGLEAIALQVGHTPLLQMDSKRTSFPSLYAKLEWQQLGASVKSRPAFNIIREAIVSGGLLYNKRILDASSGNTAIAYASIGAKLGIGITICLPENASESRVILLRALGAEIKFSSPFGGTDEAQQMARDLYHSNKDLYYYADQYSNENNWKAHYLTTAEEIWEQTSGKISHFVCGVGTSGSITGISRRLKELNPKIRVTALQPDTGMHIMEGWKHFASCKIPEIYDPFVIDDEIEVSSEESLDFLKQTALSEGLVLSPSSAANLAGATRLLEQLDGEEEAYVVTLFPDNGDKYMDIIKNWI